MGYQTTRVRWEAKNSWWGNYYKANINSFILIKKLFTVHSKNPPKYEYGYSIDNQDKASQGHKEARDGDNTQGNYYVNLPEGQSQADVKYIADDWGFHPVVRFSLY